MHEGDLPFYFGLITELAKADSDNPQPIPVNPCSPNISMYILLIVLGRIFLNDKMYFIFSDDFLYCHDFLWSSYTGKRYQVLVTTGA